MKSYTNYSWMRKIQGYIVEIITKQSYKILDLCTQSELTGSNGEAEDMLFELLEDNGNK